MLIFSQQALGETLKLHLQGLCPEILPDLFSNRGFGSEAPGRLLHCPLDSASGPWGRSLGSEITGKQLFEW